MHFPRNASFAAPLFIGLLVGFTALSGARAQETTEFVIAANDGYGVEECLAERGECGRIVADAWCEAHGHGAAVSFGPKSMFEGVGAAKISTAPEPFVVNCGD